MEKIIGVILSIIEKPFKAIWNYFYEKRCPKSNFKSIKKVTGGFTKPNDGEFVGRRMNAKVGLIIIKRICTFG